MADISTDGLVAPLARPPRAAPSRQTVLLAAALLAAVAGFVPWYTASTDVVASENALVLLLRFMAIIKGGMALGALAMVYWRFRFSASAPLAAGYIAAVAAMSAAAGLIWQIAFVVPGAIVFHAGLFLFIALICSDSGGRDEVVALIAQRRRG